MYLAAAPETQRVHTRNVAKHYGISAHHLQKTVLRLARMGYVEASPGRTGGLRLAKSPGDIRLGALVSSVENTGRLVDCDRGPCPLNGKCLLKRVLDRAERAMIQELDKTTLADVIESPTGLALLQMMTAADRASEPRRKSAPATTRRPRNDTRQATKRRTAR